VKGASVEQKNRAERSENWMSGAENTMERDYGSTC